MSSPSGDQLTLEADGYRAVVTEGGGALRLLEHRGRALLDGFGADEMSSGGRGQLLVPWPNRIRDGAYRFGGRDLRLGLTDPGTGNASHGLARWVPWTTLAHTGDAVELGHRLMAQSGYPWRLDLHVRYALGPDGLTVTQSVRNRSPEPAPYASGAHPYLAVGDGPVDHLELHLPASRRALVDERLLPVGSEQVAGTAYDFTAPRLVGGTALNDAYTDLARDADGWATVTLRDPRTGDGVRLRVDEHHPWLQLFTADGAGATARRSLAVEPMTAPPDAFRSGEDLVVLAPAGEPGDAFAASWLVAAA
ncbi:aldose 1-epimerase family protein [Nocardioides solisilvae]|uniref:aldose 1-epimerase family protein n=1 Tax=Nocardioides solisilvae TaxID=1542435 RepID=UPI000D7416D8|nr:aldose 1-epimerase family protein [Nocardioides solisilvae]